MKFLYLLSMISCERFAPSEQTTIIGSFCSLIVKSVYIQQPRIFYFQEKYFPSLEFIPFYLSLHSIECSSKCECDLIVLQFDSSTTPKKKKTTTTTATTVKCFGNRKRHMLALTFQYVR